LKPLVTGAAAHMSLHLKPTMSKSRRVSLPGVSRVTGDRLRETQTGLGRRPAPSVKGPYMEQSLPRQWLFFESFRERSGPFRSFPSRGRGDAPAVNPGIPAGPTPRAFRKRSRRAGSFTGPLTRLSPPGGPTR